MMMEDVMLQPKSSVVPNMRQLNRSEIANEQTPNVFQQTNLFPTSVTTNAKEMQPQCASLNSQTMNTKVVANSETPQQEMELIKPAPESSEIETETPITDDCQLLQLCKENNTIALNELLKREIEKLAKTKAYHEVMVPTLKNTMQEIKESRQHMEQDIIRINKHNEELEHKLKMERCRCVELEGEMNNIQKRANILKQHHETVKQNYEDIQKNAVRMEEEIEKLYKNYNVEKTETLDFIKQVDNKVQNLHDEFNEKCTEKEKEIVEKMNKLSELTKQQDEVTLVRTNLLKSIEDVQNQFNRNKEIISKVESENEALHKSIEDSHTHKLSAVEKLKALDEDVNLNNTKTKLSDVSNRLQSLEQHKFKLQKDFNEELHKTSQFESNISKGEDEYLSVLTMQQNLNAKIEEQNGELSKFSIKQQEIAKEIQELQENCDQQLTSIQMMKEEKQTYLDNINQERLQQEQKVPSLQELCEKLNDEVLTKTDKVSQIQKNKTDLKIKVQNYNSSLKEQIQKVTETCTKEILELKEKLSFAEKNLIVITNEAEQNIKNVNYELVGYKLELQQAYQNNQEVYKQKLETLQNQLKQRIIDVKQSQEKLQYTRNEVKKKKDECDKLKNKKEELLKIGNLKCISKQSEFKKVSFAESPIYFQSHDNKQNIPGCVVADNSMQESDLEELFDMIKNVSPTSLDENNAKQMWFK